MIYLSCPYCLGVFRVIADDADIRANALIRNRDLRDRAGALCGDDYGRARDILCVDCLTSVSEIEEVTGEWVFNTANLREVEALPARLSAITRAP